MRIKVLGAILAALVGLAAPAQAASLLEKNFWLSGPNFDGVVPVCEDPTVLGTIVARFAHNESTFWNSPLTIVRFEQPRELAFRPWGPDFVPRRFCAGRVMTSDGHYRTVSYFMAEDLGKIGVEWGLEWCVAGLDRSLSYAPNCKMARP
jgi:hypothetical protein